MAGTGVRTAAMQLAAALAAGLLAGPVVAQDSPLDRAKALRQVADQKAEADIRQKIEEAEKLAKYDAAKAVRRLKDAVRGLDVSVEISSEKRETLVKQLQAKIAALEGQPVAD